MTEPAKAPPESRRQPDKDDAEGFSVSKLLEDSAGIVNPPDEQIEKAFTAVGEAAGQAAAHAEAGQQELELKRFTPPREGMQVASLATKNTYTIGKVIGEGAFGRVYQATDVWLNELAVKVLKPLGTYEEVSQAAYREFEMLRQLRHAHITHVVDAFEFENTFYIVTERCEAPLADLFRIQELQGDVWVRPVARCLLQAVHFVHLNGYVHQDIHFGNVFMQWHRDEMGGSQADSKTSITFKLADLGIAKLFSEIDAKNTLLNGSMLPPEFLDSAFGQLGPRVDIYHCALLFLQLMLNKPLTFTNEEILEGKPRQLAEQLPSPYGPAIARALRRHVDDRTPTAMELWEDLNAPVVRAAEKAVEQAPPDAEPELANT